MTYSHLCRVFQGKALPFLSLFLFAVALFPLHLYAEEYNSSILSQDNNHIRIKYTFEKPQVKIDSQKAGALYNKAILLYDQNGAQLPVITDKLSLPGSKATVKVISKKQKRQKLNNYLLVADAPKTAYKMVDIRFMGLYRDISVFALSIMPVQYNQQNSEIVWTEELVLEIRNTSEIFEKQNYKQKSSADADARSLFINGSSLYQKQQPASQIQSILNTPVTSNYSNIYKIKIDQTGFYKVSYDDLLESDIPVDDLNPKYLKLLNKGSEIALFFEGSEDNRFEPGDYFEFWAEKNEKTFLKQHNDMYADPFTDENIYWLVEAGSLGKRMVEESGGISETHPSQYIIPFRFKEKIHFEQDTRWERFGYNPEFIDDVAYKYDHWFWGKPISSVSSQSFNFELAHPFVEQGNNVFVTAMFRGVSIPNVNTSQINGHQLSLWLNNEKVGDILPTDNWWGQKKIKLTNSVALSQSNLLNGENTLRINMDQEGVTDIILFNWFDIEYYKKYRADKNTLKFKLQEELFAENKLIQFQIDGFTTNAIQLYKLGLSKIVNSKVDLYRDTDNNFTSYRIIFQDQVYDPGTEYLAISNDAKLKPKTIEKYVPWKEDNPPQSLLDKSNVADLIIVTHANFMEQALRLKNIKEQQGFATEVVTVQQIYDTFNHGIKSPLAIKEFFKYAYSNWDQNRKLKYVILAGDASYDYKERLTNSNDLVPTIMFSTNGYGAAPADIQYACISGNDLIPDITIGRIPASTASEFSDYIDKIEEYKNNTDFGVWRNRALFISGNDENTIERITNKPVFRNQNNRIINNKQPQNIFAHKLNVVQNVSLGSDDPDFGGNRDLLDYFDDGLTVINFFGHGGGLIWSDKNLLNLDGVDDLNNAGKYPFISSMTCFTGAFENPTKEGLAERLVMAADKGAIAILSSSSVGWTYNDFAIQWGLHDYLWQEGVTIGDAIDKMKIAYMANSIYYYGDLYNTTPGYYWDGAAPIWSSMVNQYNLLGDPTLELIKPNKSLTLSISNHTPAAGETITIKINSEQNNGIGYLEISDENNWKYLEHTFSFNEGTFSYDFTIPTLDEDSLIIGRFFKIKSYINDGNSGASGNSNFMVEGSIIKTISMSPENPQVAEKVGFEMTAKSHSPIAHMELRKFRAENSASLGQVTLVMAQVNDSLFSSVSEHPGFAEEGTYLYEIYIRDEDGKEQKFDLNKIIVNDNRPDLDLDFNSIKYSGTERLELHFNIRNDSNMDLDSVSLQAFMGQDTLPFFNDVYSFSANEKKMYKAPLTIDSIAQQRTFRILVDPDNQITERSENNNSATKIIETDHIFVNQEIGSSANGVQNNSLSILQKWDFYLAKDNINNSTVVAFSDSSISKSIADGRQNDLKYIPFKYSEDTSAVSIHFKNPASEVVATISAYMDSTRDLSNAFFYRFNDYMGLWSKIESSLQVIDGKISADIHQNGLYAVFSSSDEDIPFIEITANGRPLRDDVLVKTRPSLAFLLQDENGIDFRNTFHVLLDDQPIPASELTLPDSLSNANSIAVLATPELDEGIHTIEVFVADLNNNASSVQRTFKVSAENRLLVYGTYPNPFESSTIIAFFNDFDNNLSRLKTKIYSVSGHLVRSKPLDAPDGISDYDPTSTDYQELVWDGSDDDGNEVANGVYFITMEAEYIEDFSNKKSTFKKTLKVAKLK